MVGMARACPGAWNHHRRAREGGVVEASELATPRVLGVEVLELHSQDSRLELVQPRVHAGKVADIALTPPVLPEPAYPVCELSITGDHGASISQRSQVLRRVKAEGGDVPPNSSLPVVKDGSVRLGAVFDDCQAVLFGDAHDRGHVGRMAIEMNGDDGFDPVGGLRLDHIFQSIGIDRRGRRVDLGQHRSSTGQLDGCDCRDRGVRNGQDRVAGPHAAGPERDVQSIGAAAHSDRMLRAEVVSELLFEFGDFLTEDVHAAVQRAADGLINLVPVREVVGGGISRKDHR